VNVLVSAVTDPISGQPEFKHAPVALEPYPAAWHGFILSRQPISSLDFGYWSRIRAKGCWRHELADKSGAPDWHCFVRNEFGQTGDWIELKDHTAQRYRAALLLDGRLQAVGFFERDAARLPTRHWLESLFEKDRIDDAERMALLMGRPAKAAPDAGRIICACFGVGENTLREAIAQGAASVEALGIQLRAGTNCGSCIPELKSLLMSKTAAAGNTPAQAIASG
jgi:assimilatory nitrate reductase catalytic subunit